MLVATIVNLLVVSMASYRGASYMDSPQFCGQSCHVMHPEYTAYKVSAHSHVACVECHIGTGVSSYFEAKINGTKQLVEVTTHPFAHLAPKIIPDYPTPIRIPGEESAPGARDLRSAATRRRRFVGEKLLVKSSFADDEQNTETQTVVVLHLGGQDSLSHLTGIHGVHLGHIEYIATDPTRTTIPWVQRTNPDGSQSTYVASALKGAMPQGERRVMDCIDCHNRASHTFVTAEEGAQPRDGRRRCEPVAAVGAQRRPGAAEGGLCEPGRSEPEDSRRSSKPFIAAAIRMCWRRRPTWCREPGRNWSHFTARMFSRR